MVKCAISVRGVFRTFFLYRRVCSFRGLGLLLSGLRPSRHEATLVTSLSCHASRGWSPCRQAAATSCRPRLVWSHHLRLRKRRHTLATCCVVAPSAAAFRAATLLPRLSWLDQARHCGRRSPFVAITNGHLFPCRSLLARPLTVGAKGRSSRVTTLILECAPT